MVRLSSRGHRRAAESANGVEVWARCEVRVQPEPAHIVGHGYAAGP
ncbi:hypothetical protein Pd630_LPD07684 [Rhodococcus opacus PD630]|nr:hypothetical protein Pd630_LPD07684 [Rhodococcus opacus PD630]